ncbi:MAG: alpha-amylase, partial [Pseudomonadota bacterium]
TRYREYLSLGKMDYLYDKVGFYDTLRPVMAGVAGTDTLAEVHAAVNDIAPHMLHFLENHDEQRIASPPFAGTAEAGRPGMAVSALIHRGPALVYFGQEVGEAATGDAGFGDPTRTTIFDYWGVPAHQAWMNGGRFDGGQLSDAQRSLRAFYGRLLRLASTHPTMQGDYASLHAYNRERTTAYTDKMFSFARWNADGALIVIASFDRDKTHKLTLQIPIELIQQWQLEPGQYALTDTLGDIDAQLSVDARGGAVELTLAPFGAHAFTLGSQ